MKPSLEKKLGKELLVRRQSGEDRGAVEGRLRHRRGIEDNIIWIVVEVNPFPVDFDKQVEVLQKISTQERN